MKKKLAIISETLSGGVRRHIVDVLENLDKDKFDIYFIYGVGRVDEVMKNKLPKLKEDGIKLIKIENLERKIGINDIRALKKIYKELKRIKPDIVHCHSSKAGILGRVGSKLVGVGQIYYSPHGYIMNDPQLSNKKKNVYSIIEAIMSRFFTTKTITVSESEKKLALDCKLDKESKFEVIYNGIDNKYNEIDKLTLKQSLNIPENNIVIGVAERMAHPKDPMTFLKIAKSILEKFDNITFMYIGDGEYKSKVDEFVYSNGLKDGIKLLGFRSDVEDLMQIVDVYLATSLCEGLPYSLIEALKYSTPIVATNTTGHNSIVKENINGVFFEVLNTNDGIDKILYLINNKSILEKMSVNSKIIFEEKFLISSMIEEINHIYTVT